MVDARASAADPAVTWLGTSWKMTKTLAQARAYAERLRGVTWPDGLQSFLIPPATAIHTVATTLAGEPMIVGAQDAHWEDAGAWTGEVSVPQVVDAGARVVEIGHSERRAHFGETDERVGLKVQACVRHGVLPLVCVGESADDRAAGCAVDVVVGQVSAALAGVPTDSPVLLAYEPVWAIGEHGTPATPDAIVDVVAAMAEVGGAGRPVLYGGSVNEGNAADLCAVPHVRGLFVGRAAWEVGGLLALAEIVGR